jgi:hypothetical protein
MDELGHYILYFCTGRANNDSQGPLQWDEVHLWHRMKHAVQHQPGLGFEPGSKGWKLSALPTVTQVSDCQDASIHIAFNSALDWLIAPKWFDERWNCCPPYSLTRNWTLDSKLVVLHTKLKSFPCCMDTGNHAYSNGNAILRDKDCFQCPCLVAILIH